VDYVRLAVKAIPSVSVLGTQIRAPPFGITLTGGSKMRVAYVMDVSAQKAVVVREGVMGNYAVTPAVTSQEVVDKMNDNLGVDREMALAMEAGSMFGWNVPACKPEKYEWKGVDNGKKQ
jgi:hypothetical protein